MATIAVGAGAGASGGPKTMAFKDKDKPYEVRLSNITAAKGILAIPLTHSGCRCNPIVSRAKGHG